MYTKAIHLATRAIIGDSLPSVAAAGAPEDRLYQAVWAALAAAANMAGWSRAFRAWSALVAVQDESEIPPPPFGRGAWELLPGTGRLQAADRGGWKSPVGAAAVIAAACAADLPRDFFDHDAHLRMEEFVSALVTRKARMQAAGEAEAECQ